MNAISANSLRIVQVYSFTVYLFHILHIRPHPALLPFDRRKVFKHDLLGQHLVAKVARTEIHGVLFRVVYPFVEQKYLHLPFFEKSAGSTAVQPQIRQQKRERLAQRKAAFHDLLLAAERRIGDNHIPLRRLILKEVLPRKDMREDDLVSRLFQRDNKLAVLGIERTPDDGVSWQKLDNRQHRMTRRI